MPQKPGSFSETLSAAPSGPAYLLSNLAGGVWGLLHKSDDPADDSLGARWHSHWNWNERGLQKNPPRSW